MTAEREWAESFSVIPAVDVLAGSAVRLVRGAFDAIAYEGGDPVALAARFADAGAPLVHLVDLEGARGGRVRPELVATVVAAVGPATAVQASGGVRSPADAGRLLDAGAARVVVGTAAFAQPDALRDFVDALGERLVVALDVRAGRIAVAGWTRDSALAVEEAASRCAEAGVPRVLCTAIERDGTLSGPDTELLKRVRVRAGFPVLAAGGVRDADDLRAIAATGCEGAIVGRALGDGTLATAGLWPTP